MGSGQFFGGRIRHLLRWRQGAPRIPEPRTLVNFGRNIDFDERGAPRLVARRAPFFFQLVARLVRRRASHRFGTFNRADSHARQRFLHFNRALVRENIQWVQSLRRNCDPLREVFNAMRLHVLLVDSSRSNSKPVNWAEYKKRKGSRIDCARRKEKLK